MPIIIGDIAIEVDAKDNNGSGIARVEFYINGKLKLNDTSAPYDYTWKRDRLRLIHMQIIKVVAYDNAGNSAEAKMIVRKIL
jgi:chitinase